MLLQDYDHHGRTWALDPRTGFVSPASGRCHGFVHVGGEAAAALYADPLATEAVLWFQYGQRRWNCSAVTALQLSAPGGSRTFTLEEAGRAVFELRYPAPDPGPFDPSYDWIDAEADDFFLWAAGRLAEADPTSPGALLAHFRAGFLPS
jgi:hypothetical protein